MAFNPPDSSSLTEALAKTMEAATHVQQIQDGQGDIEPAVGKGADGLVAATAKMPGTIDLRIDPQAMRLGSEMLSIEVAKAVNDALEMLREQVGASGAAVDLEDLNQQLGEVQQQVSKSMSSFIDGLMSAHARAAEREDGR